MRSYSVMVITKDSESFDPGSSPGRTFCFSQRSAGSPVSVSAAPNYPVPVAQLDKASDYESEDWGFKSLQGYFFTGVFFFCSNCTAALVRLPNHAGLSVPGCPRGLRGQT